MAKGFMIAGTHSGSGKTTLALGIMGALAERGEVAAFKVGPDYIDTAYHRFVTKAPSYNLDVFMQGEEKLKDLYLKKSEGRFVSVVEGVMGLFDGLDDTGYASSAYVAKLLSLPVILVVDASGMARSISAMVKGYKEFDEGLNVKGVILNRVSGEGHFSLLKRCLKQDLKIPALGYLPYDGGLSLPERHLGLLPVWEMKNLEEKFETLFEKVKKYVDLEELLSIASSAKIVENPYYDKKSSISEAVVKIGVAMDEAFNFYYAQSLETLRELGAELVFFSPLGDSSLPEGISGLIIGGGFPEIFAEKLSSNNDMMKSIREAFEAGMPIYAECGGLMYLGKSITDGSGRRFPMVGVFEMDSVMTDGLKRFGYAEATVMEDTVIAPPGAFIRGHEFHYSEVINSKEKTSYIVRKRNGKTYNCGFKKKNCLGTFLHVDFYAYPELGRYFIEKCRRFKEGELR
ncbi:MAG: cobyrinic acid a,c-diamide synthase [Tepidanaerobacteraceae bacterium]|nr:cobyrinic acid a,c-diamide synthase [Tepidanaerobacteraceae bacterium]